MVELFWVWVAAGGGVAIGMFLFALMTMAAHGSGNDVVVVDSTRDALT